MTDFLEILKGYAQEPHTQDAMREILLDKMLKRDPLKDYITNSINKAKQNLAYINSTILPGQGVEHMFDPKEFYISRFKDRKIGEQAYNDAMHARYKAWDKILKHPAYAWDRKFVNTINQAKNNNKFIPPYNKYTSSAPILYDTYRRGYKDRPIAVREVINPLFGAGPHATGNFPSILDIPKKAIAPYLDKYPQLKNMVINKPLWYTPTPNSDVRGRASVYIGKPTFDPIISHISKHVSTPRNFMDWVEPIKRHEMNHVLNQPTGPAGNIPPFITNRLFFDTIFHNGRGGYTQRPGELQVALSAAKVQAANSSGEAPAKSWSDWKAREIKRGSLIPANYGGYKVNLDVLYPNAKNKEFEQWADMIDDALELDYKVNSEHDQDPNTESDKKAFNEYINDLYRQAQINRRTTVNDSQYA